jgi:fumarylacetoacetase
MPSPIDHTHDPKLRSWVTDANGHRDFPIQNLPLGIFRRAGAEAQSGVAIGDHVLALRALGERGLVDGDALVACEAAAGSTLNELFILGARYRMALRRAVSSLLAEGAKERYELLHPAAECEVLLPARIGDYTDFYAGIIHAENVGKLFRPDNPLLPNYKWVPIGYNGRSSSVQVSGVAVRRPSGQHKLADEVNPSFSSARNLDFELELGVWIGPGNALGDPIEICDAENHISGYCLLNDWSARDIQTWEYQPLGPFLAKSFHTTISGWVISPEALAPFRQAQKPRDISDPKPLPHLFSESDQAEGALKIEVEVLLSSPAMRGRGLAPQRITGSHAEDLYWTPAQLVAHHASNGCNLRAGDLLGTGTISSRAADGCGSLLELTFGGRKPLTLSSGETRTFLQDGDEVTLRARASREGYVPIGFGECRAVVK